MLDESRLHRVKILSVSQSLNGGHFIAIVHQSKTEARLDAPAVDDDRASATLSMIAPFLAACQVKAIAQHIKKGHTRIDVQRVIRTIYLERQRLRAVQSGNQLVFRLSWKHIFKVRQQDRGGNHQLIETSARNFSVHNATD